jgi:hypothetical protein
MSCCMIGTTPSCKHGIAALRQITITSQFDVHTILCQTLQGVTCCSILNVLDDVETQHTAPYMFVPVIFHGIYACCCFVHQLLPVQPPKAAVPLLLVATGLSDDASATCSICCSPFLFLY